MVIYIYLVFKVDVYLGCVSAGKNNNTIDFWYSTQLLRHSMFLVFFQNEKTQILTTFLWVRMVSVKVPELSRLTLCLLC